MDNFLLTKHHFNFRKLFFFVTIFLFCSLNAQQTEWIVPCGGLYSDKGISIGTDTLGYIYISGYFNGQATFGSHTVNAPATNSKDFFVAKMDSFGNFLWAASGGGFYDDRALGMHVDKGGNVYVTGTIWNVGTFGSINVAGIGNYDASVLAKLDTDGNWLWAKGFGGAPANSSSFCPQIPWHGDDHAYDVKVDDDGFIYVTGFWSGGTMLFPNIQLSNPDWYSRCSPAGYIAKLDTNGDVLWARQFDGVQDQRGSRDNRLAIDEFSNIYVTGGFDSIGVYGPDSLTNNGGWDVFLFKMDTDGNWIWAKNVGSNKDDRANGIAVDDCNDVYITGEYRNPMVFEGANASNGTDTLSHRQKRDVFVAKITSDGEWVWAKRARSDGKEKSYQMSVDKNFNTYIAGETADTIKFNSLMEVPNDQVNPFVAQLASNGDWQWVKVVDSPLSIKEKANDIAVDDFGNAYAVGYFSGSGDFDGVSVSSPTTRDIFVWRIKTVDNPVNYEPDTSYTTSYSCNPMDTGIFMTFDTNVVFCTDVIDVEIDSVIFNSQIIESASIGSQSVCDSNINTYTQEIVVTYPSASTGQIDVNGQIFTTTGSPQTILLENLIADGLDVDLVAHFVNDTCGISIANAFTAPENCYSAPCPISNILISSQSACDEAANTYSQTIIIYYNFAPNAAQVNVNGQLFTATGTPQTVVLENLIANGQSVDINAYVVNDTCVMNIPNAFIAPENCLVSTSCPVDDIMVGNQSNCDEATNTYSQDIIVYYTGEPDSGEIDINGQFFPITGSPQTITLTNLLATGGLIDVFAQFSVNPSNCIYVRTDAFISPNPCGDVGVQYQFVEGTQVYSYDNTIVVDLSQTVIDGITQVDIFSIIGQLIKQGDIENNKQAQYQLNNHAAGHYIVRLVNDDKYASYKVFIEK